MRRLLGAVLVILMTSAGCAPTASGPMLPRPAPLSTTTTATVRTATTMAVETVDSAESPDSPTCPTVFCLVYDIDPRAEWSDGAAVTAEDFARTVTVNQEGLTEGPYGHVRDVMELPDRRVMVVLDEPVGAWESFFSRIYRSGRDAGVVDEVDTTGPFQFVEWEEGDHLTIARSPEWWASTDPISGAPLGDVGTITFVFIDDLSEMIGALEDGDVDVIVARPDVAALEDLEASDGIEYSVAPGPFWEHIDFHHDDPLLSRPWIREVFSLAIDRDKILDRTIRLIDPDASVLDNTVFMPGTPYYEPHFVDAFDPDRAERIMIDHGCSREDESAVFVCDQIPMSFVWASTNDDPARAETFESVREDLAVVGIEIVPDLRSPSEFVTRDVLFGGPEVWQLIDFSWRARPEPIASNPTYYCVDAGALNVNRYCSAEIESLVRSTETITDPVARAAIYNLADRLYLGDRALIPLYQKPTMMAWSNEIHGPEPNYTLSSDLWNVASWTGKESIVVALPAEPVDMNPMMQGDDNANIILSALVYGAFGMNPSQQRIPLLVESVELVTGTN